MVTTSPSLKLLPMDRVTELTEAHEWMSTGEARLILVAYYKAHREKHTAESFEDSIQAYTQHLCEQTPHYVKNVLSVAFENSSISRAEIHSFR